MRYAIVTGSTKGIGKAIGMRLLQEGYFVIFNYAHDDNSASELESELINFHQSFKIIKENLCDENGVNSFVKHALKISNCFDVIVLNAGVTSRSEWNNLTWEEWTSVLNTNLTAPAFLTKLLGAHINNNGSILFIGSLLGINAHASSAAYAVSKAGVHMLSSVLVKEYADRYIRVNTIAPGFTDTTWQKTKPQAQKQRIEDKIALKRFAQATEIAKLAIEVINNKYINGSVLEIHGGYSYK